MPVDRGQPGFLLQRLPGDLLRLLDSWDGDGSLLACHVADGLLQELLPHLEALLAFPLQAGALHLVHDKSDGELGGKIEMLSEEDAEQGTACRDGRHGALLPVATAEVDNGRTGDAAEPRQEAQGRQPWPDGIGPPGDGPAAANDNLQCVGS